METYRSYKLDFQRGDRFVRIFSPGSPVVDHLINGGTSDSRPYLLAAAKAWVDDDIAGRGPKPPRATPQD